MFNQNSRNSSTLGKLWKSVDVGIFYSSFEYGSTNFSDLSKDFWVTWSHRRFAEEKTKIAKKFISSWPTTDNKEEKWRTSLVEIVVSSLLFFFFYQARGELTAKDKGSEESLQLQQSLITELKSACGYFYDFFLFSFFFFGFFVFSLSYLACNLFLSRNIFVSLSLDVFRNSCFLWYSTKK